MGRIIWILVFGFCCSSGPEGACIIYRDVDGVCIGDVSREDCMECTASNDCECSDLDSCCNDEPSTFESFHEGKACSDVEYPRECLDNIFWHWQYSCEEVIENGWTDDYDY